jgi:hypothetical protein
MRTLVPMLVVSLAILSASFAADIMPAPMSIYVDDNAAGDPGPQDATISDPNEDGSPEHPFDTIQEAIDAALDGDTVVVLDGMYMETIDLKGKSIVVTGFSEDPMQAYPVIDGSGKGTVVTFGAVPAPEPNEAPMPEPNEAPMPEPNEAPMPEPNEAPAPEPNDVIPVGAMGQDSVPYAAVCGLRITGGLSDMGSAIQCVGSNAMVSNCIIVGNRTTNPDGGAVVYLENSSCIIENCTITDNYAGAAGASVYQTDSDVTILNSIIRDTTAAQILVDSANVVGSVDDPLDMADSSGDIKSIEAWVDEGNLNLTMTVYGVFAPSVEETPEGMSNRYYYHWILDTDNNPDTGYLNNEYEGNPTNLESPIGIDVLIQFGWRDGATNGVYGYTLDPLTGDEVELFQDYEYTIEGDTLHAVIPLADLGLELGQTIAVSGYQEGASNDWQVDWVESFELTLGQDSADGPVVTYSDIEGTWPGDGNIDADPLFAYAGYWADGADPNLLATEPNDPNAIWMGGDYHVMSVRGRWDPVLATWVKDSSLSPCIDAGDPNSAWENEPEPNGGRINMGAYGGTAQASLTRLLRTLTTSSYNGGSVTTPGEGSFTYVDDTQAQVVATPEKNYYFLKWTGTAVDAGKVANPKKASITVLMDGDYTLKADFAAVNYTLSVSSTTGGSVTVPGEGNFVYGGNYIGSLEAVADPGYHFTHWSGSAVDQQRCVSPDRASTSVIVDGNYSVKANFAPNIYTLSISSGEGGSVTEPGEGSFEYAYGTTVSIQATPDEHYRFVEWTGSAVDAGAVGSPDSASTSVLIGENYSLVANFERVSCTLTVNVNCADAGSVTSPGQGTFVYDCGTVVDLSATPSEGYKFCGWAGPVADGDSASTTVTLEEDTTVKAIFMPIEDCPSDDEDPEV